MPARTPLIADVVFCTTPKGHDALRRADGSLSERSVRLLMMIDGERSAVGLLGEYAEAELAAHLVVLEACGHIQARPGDPVSESDDGLLPDSALVPAPALLQALSVPACRGDLGGLRQHLLIGLLGRIGAAAEPFVLTIMRCQTVRELRRLLPAILSIVEVKGGPVAVEQFAREIAQP